jgi:site-specific DNA recombinase
MIVTADLYLRLSDFRSEDADSFPAREKGLRSKAAELGWTVGRVVVENDITEDGRRKAASAWKRRKVTTPSGRVELRTVRPGWRAVLDDLTSGAANAVLAEDLDRVARDPRDMEDLIDAVAACRGHARSVSGSLMLTSGGTSDQVTMARIMCTMANKSSADTARRVGDGRERIARLGSYGGGRRPFGFRHDPDAPKYGKKLLIVPEEAAAIRKVAEAVLAEGADGRSLRFMASKLRADGVPTVTGTPWTSSNLRDIMLKPCIAGIAVNSRTRVETKGAWPGILSVQMWEDVRAKLTDPSRRISPGPAPRWLGSGIYRCGPCLAEKVESRVWAGGRGVYACQRKAHLRRASVQTDDLVAEYVIAYLNLPENADILRPAVAADVDEDGLRARQLRLIERGQSQAAMHALGDITDDELSAGSKARQEELTKIARQLSAVKQPDPLAEFRGQPDARTVWDRLPLYRRRDLVAALVVVTLVRARKQNSFDAYSVRVEAA